MNTPTSETLALLAYRMNAVAIGQLALQHVSAWKDVPSMEIYFDGKQVVEGLATGFTNGAIEAAVLHCRALLEFLGLGARTATELSERRPSKRRDDVGIDDFSPLRRLSVQAALRAYPGPKEDAEAALAFVVNLANKGLAHMTTALSTHHRGWEFLDIAFRGVPVLVLNEFYAPLGIAPPVYELQSRRRPS